jgi:hypothetical protein
MNDVGSGVASEIANAVKNCEGLIVGSGAELVGD